VEAGVAGDCELAEKRVEGSGRKSGTLVESITRLPCVLFAERGVRATRVDGSTVRRLRDRPVEAESGLRKEACVRNVLLVERVR
jgi:hypothetical protein